MSLPIARQAAAATPGAATPSSIRPTRTVTRDVRVRFEGSLQSPADSNAAGVATEFSISPQARWKIWRSDAFLKHTAHLVESRVIGEGVEPTAAQLASYGESHEDLTKAHVVAYNLLEYSSDFPVDLMLDISGAHGRVVEMQADGTSQHGVLLMPANCGHQVIGGENGRTIYEFQQLLADATTAKYANFDATTLLDPVTHLKGLNEGTSLVPRNCQLFGLLAMNSDAIDQSISSEKEQLGGVPVKTQAIKDCVASFHAKVIAKLPRQDMTKWAATIARVGAKMYERKGVQGISAAAGAEKLNEAIMTTPHTAWALVRVKLAFPE